VCDDATINRALRGTFPKERIGLGVMNPRSTPTPTLKCEEHLFPVWGCNACREAAKGEEFETEIHRQLSLIQVARKKFEEIIESSKLPDGVAKEAYEFFDRLDDATEMISYEARPI